MLHIHLDKFESISESLTNNLINISNIVINNKNYNI